MWSLMKTELDLGGRKAELGRNVMYETGNAKNLGRFLTALRMGVESVVDDDLETMEVMISHYSSIKPHVGSGSPATEKDAVVSLNSSRHETSI